MANCVNPKKKVTLNPLTGKFELVTDNNFSYQSVPESRFLTIHENNQMAVFDGFELEGELILDGNLVVED